LSKELIRIPVERVEKAILLVRGEKVILDSDLAGLYGVTTKRLNEQVKRNRGRFPEDFMFKLTSSEKAEVVAICDHLKKLKFSAVLPFAFTEHGAIMAANVLNSKGAVEASIQVVRTFIRLRQMLASNAELARKLSEIERKYDAHFKVVFDALRQLMTPQETQRRQIGFRKDDKEMNPPATETYCVESPRSNPCPLLRSVAAV
jgi:hypothetical protein